MARRQSTINKSNILDLHKVLIGILEMKFKEVACLCERLSKINSRNEKIGLISNFLRGLDPNDVKRACRMIIGRPFPKSSQKRTNVSKKSLHNALEGIIETEKYNEYYDKYGDFGEVISQLLRESEEKQSTLKQERNSLKAIQNFLDSLSRIQGEGSVKERNKLIEAKFSHFDPLEGKYMSKLLLGSSRHGVSDSLVIHAISDSWDALVEKVRKAYMLTGDLGEAAILAKRGKLEEVEIEYQRPFLPMLAETADSVLEIREEMGHCLCEEKLDGVRIQVHKGDSVEFYTRNLNRVTDNFPDLAEKLDDVGRRFIAEGELIALKNNSILPFQRLMRRFRENVDEQLVGEIPVEIRFFDLLKFRDVSLVDDKLKMRIKKLKSELPKLTLTRRVRTDDIKEIEEFFQGCVDRGNEGIIAKDLESRYQPGERGKNWLKLKRTGETLDLVITRAEYGHGKRHKWLSDYYLAAYDEEEEEFKEVGKTYKGLTDVEIRKMTERLEDAALDKKGRTVTVDPGIVVEVEYSNIFSGESSNYDSGYTLRFARIKGIREDWGPENADTLGRVSELARKK
ncbi:hypothetical protein AKJ51_02635 [candidate division MSBL1 archaeon SCGC-AAA382A20]|uniref:DNA ligase n=1 Tax=candidate division MSBL1 archaeon SCGC-AAA382A20 TaxID=1698280 RepID=A0A133VK99_9EURY|nr:hypothetical protein AKJ51_02635 [candidate division MSBL1 archaeon SCGC-AAA382A20]